MAKKEILKTVAGLAVAGAAVGGAIAYLKKCKDVNDLSEEDFDDLTEDEEMDCSCQTERTYVDLPKESGETSEEEKTEEPKEEDTPDSAAEKEENAEAEESAETTEVSDEKEN